MQNLGLWVLVPSLGILSFVFVVAVCKTEKEKKERAQQMWVKLAELTRTYYGAANFLSKPDGLGNIESQFVISDTLILRYSCSVKGRYGVTQEEVMIICPDFQTLKIIYEETLSERIYLDGDIISGSFREGENRILEALRRKISERTAEAASKLPWVPA